jgi:hypothetical protein
MDNFFLNVPLFLKLRKLGISAYGIARQNCSGFPKELRIGKSLTGNRKLDYHFLTGTEIGRTKHCGGVLALLWMDNAPVTMLTTVYIIRGVTAFTITERKRPRDTSSNAVGVRQLYGPGEFIKELPIPTCIHNYNQFMGGVDIADQYRSYYTTQITQRRNWLPIFFWILDTALINSFIIYRDFLNLNTESGCPITQKDFNIELAWAWINQEKISDDDDTNDALESSLIILNDEKGPYVKEGTLLPSFKDRTEGTHLPIVENMGVCFWCRWKSKNSINSISTDTPSRTSFLCSSCGIHLCISKKKNCFEAFHTEK